VPDQVSEQGVTDVREPGELCYGGSEKVVKVAYGALRRVGGHPDTVRLLLHQWYVFVAFTGLFWNRQN
jgi:hypothetical protein